MSSPSNLYAEKIFSEHPTVFWALDDKADYISLISDSDRNISSWQGISGGTAQTSTALYEPFPDSVTTLLIGDVPTDPQGDKIECISPDTSFNLSDLDQNLSTFSIGAFIYTDSNYLSKVELGYEYDEPITGNIIQNLKTFSLSISGRWLFVSETFSAPNHDVPLRMILKVGYDIGGSSTDDYKFYVNGLSLGQWSEEFNSTSLGSEPISIPVSNPLGSASAIEAKSYGLQNAPGYYLINNSQTLAAKNSSMPMVYGASNITTLLPNSDLPSLILPGSGFLNEQGKYQTYTTEFWLRLSCDSAIDKRIFGPIGKVKDSNGEYVDNTDGLYVRGPFITLKLGNNVGTYYVGEWTRPMLVDIKYSPDSISLLINSEQVISLSIDASTIEFSPKTYNGVDQDWLGFYAYDDVSPIDLDCVAIYPYQVSQVLAKRRWVYGQGVEFPENINTAYSGSSMFIDYAFANYSNSYNYPGLGKWNQGVAENLSLDSNVLSAPSYDLPTVVFDNKTNDEWITDLSAIQNESSNLITLRPSRSGADWSGTNGYMLIDSLNAISSDIKGFYGVFKQKAINSAKEILFQIEDVSTSNYFQVAIQEHKLSYTLGYGSETTEIYSSVAQNIGQEFSVGIFIDRFVEYFGGNLAAFFGKKSSLKMYIGGNSGFENTFRGNIYSIGICTSRNISKISQSFNERGLTTDTLVTLSADGGTPITTSWDALYDGQYPQSVSWDTSINPNSDNFPPLDMQTSSLLDFVASYTLKLNEYFNTYKLDIATDSYWEDYLPLTYLAKYVKDADGFSHYDIDFIQFNINYPAPTKLLEQQTTGSWTYQELYEKFSVPVQRTYESLDNNLFTGYENYTDLSNKTFKTYTYDTSNSMVKTYISFRYLASGVSSGPNYFTHTIRPDKNNVVIPGTYVIGTDEQTQLPIYDSFENTRYEVIDDMIIYPPKNVDFNELAIVTHVEFLVDGISQNPIKIRKLQYASQALNDTTPNTIGTRFGTTLYPYKKSGAYFDYKSMNPFTIYKGSSPYLYLTRNSGIQLRGEYDPLVNRGIQIPVNEAKSQDYKMTALQMAIRYGKDTFPYAPTEILQVESKDALIKVYMVANHPTGKRAKLYAVNAKTGRVENGIAFYLNGKIVKEPNISIKEWSMLGIKFSNSLDFRNYFGAIRITGPVLVNSLSQYKSTSLQEVQQTTKRIWSKVKQSGMLDFDWAYWDNSFIWNGVLVISSNSFSGVTPDDIYKTYTGTNKIIVDDNRLLKMKSFEYRSLNNVLWQTAVTNAV